MHNYHIYKHITDAKDKVKYCVSAVGALGVGDDRCWIPLTIGITLYSV